MAHRFHPWEGGEGKVTTQYTTSLLELGKAEIAKEHWSEAKEILEKALVYPENLGEGKLEGTKDNHIHYYLGLAKEHLGENEAAKEEYEAASIGTDEPAGMMYYNDQPADMIYYQGLAKEKVYFYIQNRISNKMPENPVFKPFFYFVYKNYHVCKICKKISNTLIFSPCKIFYLRKISY